MVMNEEIPLHKQGCLSFFCFCCDTTLVHASFGDLTNAKVWCSSKNVFLIPKNKHSVEPSKLSSVSLCLKQAYKLDILQAYKPFIFKDKTVKN